MSKVVTLRKHERISRSSEQPGFIRDALMFRSAKRWGKSIFEGSNVTLRCHSTSWERVGGPVYDLPEDEQGWVKRQSRFGWVEKDGMKIGALEAVRYEVGLLTGNEEFAFIMDMDSGYEAAFGVILADAWEDLTLDVTDFGTIIELRYAWIAPDASLHISMAKLFERLLQPWLNTHAVLVTKAFPLEYEGYIEPGEETNPSLDFSFRRRRRALVRLFSQSGFKSFPGHAGADGWMLRVADRLAGVVTPPSSGMLNQVIR